MIGTTLGPCRVLEKLGEGGMGEVYRARDTSLNRDVALKVLPAGLAGDADRLARFQREAEALAALNHPNIAAIYGIERGGDTPALVMELVEGDDLSVRIARGAMPLEEALPIARQIAEALEAAHERGIIHRDLKPANIKVRDDGTVKVLDFGLAKALDSGPSDPGTPGPLDPTMTSPALTQMGIILGTAAYMSPEQASGKPVDKRSDLWAFGVVLVEMLTGTRPFEGETVSHVIASILKDAPNLSTLSPDTPAPVLKVLRRCLEKDRRKRLDSAAVARLEIDDAMSGAGAADSGSLAPPVAPVWTRALPWAVTAIVTIAAVGALAVSAPWKTTTSSQPRRLLADIGTDASLAVEYANSVALSPDGTTLVFAAEQGGAVRLFVRTLNQLEAAVLPGTEGASSPFFSPDSKWIGFFAGSSLRKVLVSGGAALPVADVGPLAVGTWADDGTIVYTDQQGTVMKVSSAGGGTPEAFGALGEGAPSCGTPQALPGGVSVLCTELASEPDTSRLVVIHAGGGTPKTVLTGGYFGRYLPGGYLVYVRQGTLFGIRFDLERLEVVGESIPVLEDVLTKGWAGVAELAFSTDGTVVYVPATVANLAYAINWTTRDGQTSPLMEERLDWANPSFSPDGEKLAMDVSDGKQRDIWVYEWKRNRKTQLTFDPTEERFPVWSPDGEQIVFLSTRANDSTGSIRVVNADGTGEPMTLFSPGWGPIPMSWKSDGRVLATLEFPQASPGLFRISMLPLTRGADQRWTAGESTVFVDSPSIDAVPQFSRDDRWVAYSSNEAGTFNIYVRPFQGPGGPWKVSAEGGQYPRWSRTANQLLFLGPDGQVFFAPYSVEGDSFHAETPRLWTSTRSLRPGGAYRYDIHPDGTRLAVAAAVELRDVVRDRVVIMTNFFDYVKQIVEGKQ